MRGSSSRRYLGHTSVILALYTTVGSCDERALCLEEKYAESVSRDQVVE